MMLKMPKDRFFWTPDINLENLRVEFLKPRENVWNLRISKLDKKIGT